MGESGFLLRRQRFGVGASPYAPERPGSGQTPELARVEPVPAELSRELDPVHDHNWNIRRPLGGRPSEHICG